jgi:hypothetical protein
MKRLWMCALLFLLPAPALAQNTQPADDSRLWVVAGAASGTLRGHCQDCGADFPFRHGPGIVGNGGYRVSPRLDVGGDVFWMQWRNESSVIQAVAFDAVAQFRPWVTKGFFLKGGAGMAFVRNWVQTQGPNPDDSKALAVVFGTGWEFKPKGHFGLQLFATQYVGALGDLATTNGLIENVTGNFWALGAAIVIR